MIINIIIAWIHRNSTVQISKKNIAVEEILKTLGLSVGCLKRAFYYTLMLVICWIITSFGINALTLLWLHHRTTLINNIAMIVTFQHPMHVNTSIEMVFTSSIRDMGLRLKCINRLLLLHSKVKVNNWILNHYQVSSATESYQSEKKNSVTPSFPEYEAPFQNINKTLNIMKYLHLEINLLCNRIMMLYGFQLCMALSIIFVVMTCMCYAMWLTVFNPTLTSHERIIRSVVLSGWLLVYVFKFSLINIISAKTAAEYKRTGEIIHQIAIQSQDKELIENIQQFSIQIMQNPLTFSPCGFVQLGYPLIKNFIASMTTYLVIIIQMSDP
ncbi:putative gustatory receptor 28b [Chelonus insularis]|uniref:putative gustatory receptor 28b n=1 Tax=Chelonus insularis TaxID=460826 RepID=UPI00158D9011|nr:putative gustatory receptor 28b [Chelonus insularis]